MPQDHKVIIIPGLGDNVGLTSWATKRWKRYSLESIVYPMEWNNAERQFQTKLNQLTALIDQYAAGGDKVSLVGCSAGASAALNAFFERQSAVNKAVSICGRLKTGNQQGFRSLETRAKFSPSFAESVKLFESRESGHTEYYWTNTVGKLQ